MGWLTSGRPSAGPPAPASPPELQGKGLIPPLQNQREAQWGRGVAHSPTGARWQARTTWPHFQPKPELHHPPRWGLWSPKAHCQVPGSLRPHCEETWEVRLWDQQAARGGGDTCSPVAWLCLQFLCGHWLGGAGMGEGGGPEQEEGRGSRGGSRKTSFLPTVNPWLVYTGLAHIPPPASTPAGLLAQPCSLL